VAERYEEADGRRKVASEYLLTKLGQFKYTGSFEKLLLVTERILDIGAGTGYWMGKGKRPLKNVAAYDISVNMLKQIRADCLRICGDAHRLPFKSNMFDKVICLSTLHHLTCTEEILQEVERVLKRGGVFYSDLDLDWNFYRNFKVLLVIYRWFRNAPARYKVEKDLYQSTEVHSQGIRGEVIAAYLKDTLGFCEVKINYHWGDGKPWREGFAPYVSIWAVK